MDISTKKRISQITTFAALAVALYALKEIGGTMGYDTPRMKSFAIVLFIAVALGLVSAVFWRYYKEASKNYNYEQIAIETLAQIGNNKDNK